MDNVLPDLRGYQDYLKSSQNPTAVVPTQVPAQPSHDKIIADQSNPRYQLYHWGGVDITLFQRATRCQKETSGQLGFIGCV